MAKGGWLGVALAAFASLGMQASAQAGGEGVATSPPRVFGILYRAGPNWRPGVPMSGQGLRDHFFYVKRLHERGRIVAAGPLGATGGLILLKARDQAEADAVVAADPAVTAGLFVGEARPFDPRFVGAEPLSPVAP